MAQLSPSSTYIIGGSLEKWFVGEIGSETPPASIITGNPIGLLLALTYTTE